MKIVAKAGDVTLIVDGVKWKRKKVRRLLMDVAGLAASLQTAEPESQVFGFGASTERATVPEPEAWFSDDDE